MQDFNYAEFCSLVLPSEAEIINRWDGDWTKPVVSIICTTYNHENYIEDALRGFLIQKTTFPFEIIIHDDASTDDTQNVISRYSDQYPNLIRSVFQIENQYSKGECVLRLATDYSKANILAICEGDDFWINEKKLATQQKIMSENSDVGLIVHPCIAYNEYKRKTTVAYEKGDDISRFDAQDVLNIAGQFAPTASYMVKREVFDLYPSWVAKAPVGDFFLEMYSLKLGKGIYIPDVMSAYRTYATNSWTDIRRRSSNGDSLISHGHKMNACFCRMREDIIFRRLNFCVKQSAIHLEMATGYLLNKDMLNFKKHIIESYTLYPDSSLIQNVFVALRWFPMAALVLLRAKRRLNMLLKVA